jgi:NADH-ubiquinone oxidoreductase chain 5
MPTPVSALIHAATMVTAGVYLLMRFSPLLEWSSTSLQLIIWLGGLSALLGAAAGLLENDIKRVIAYCAALKRNTTVRVEFLLWWSQP